MSPANSLVLDKSFMYIRGGQNVESCGTHGLTSAKEETCPCRTTLCFLYPFGLS